MRRLGPRVGLAAAAVVCLGALAPGPAHPAEAPPDTAFHQFLGTLSDSTDRYFGLSAAPLDTLGLEAEEPYEGRTRFSFGGLPTFSFSRVDGSTFGAEVRRFGYTVPACSGASTLGPGDGRSLE